MKRENTESIRKLGEIQKALSSKYGKSFCEDASEVIQKELGFPAVTGYVKVDEEGHSEYNGHNWNLNPETGNYIDINLGQFGKGFPGISVMPRDSEQAKRIYEVFTPASFS